MSSEVRALLVFLLILGLGWIGYPYAFSDDGRVHVVLAEVRGQVEVESGGERAAAHSGDAVQASDRLVAGKDGSAVLAIGADNTVTIERDTRVEITAVDGTGVRLSLADGRVHATVRPGGPRVAVEAGASVVTGADADFDVARGPEGVGVQASRGAVQVDGVAVSAGQRTLVPPDGPALQMPASEALLLDVAWPKAPRTASATVEVAGQTEPGARVRIVARSGTVEVRADSGGAFHAPVALEEGENDLSVEAVNVFGQTRRAPWHVVRDSTPPVIGVEIR